MILTEHNILHYLLNNDMITAEPVIKGEYSARRNDSRNNNFIINREYEQYNYFIKQVKANDAEKIESLRVEAACYQLAENDPQYKILQDFLPHFYKFDTVQHILVTGLIKDAFSLQDHYMSAGDPGTTIAVQLAQLLASYQTPIKPGDNKEEFTRFRKQMPWVFTIHHNNPEQWMGNAKTAEQQAMQLIFKNKEFVKQLGQQEALWQPLSLVHNDIKFTNFLTKTDIAEKGPQFIKLIDWELADIGDPIWDAASILHSYLMLWIGTDIPEQQQYPGFRKFTLQQVQPACREFWKAYVNAQVPGQDNSALLDKAIRFCAMKLVHTCFEYTPHTPTLQPVSVRVLQVASNILRSPSAAAFQLFSIQ